MILIEFRDLEGLHRFHNFPPGFLLEIDPEEIAHPDPLLGLYLERDPQMKIGFNYFSSESISFHYVQSSLMLQIDAFLFDCPKKQIDEYYDIVGHLYFERSNDSRLLLK